jgi:hypothetical protein
MINIFFKFCYWFVYTITSLFSLIFFGSLPKVSLWRFYEGDIMISEMFHSKFEKEEHIGYISDSAKKRIIEDFLTRNENHDLLIKYKIEEDGYETTLVNKLRLNNNR